MSHVRRATMGPIAALHASVYTAPVTLSLACVPVTQATRVPTVTSPALYATLCFIKHFEISNYIALPIIHIFGLHMYGINWPQY